MLTVAEARARILAGLVPTGPEIVSLADAWGRVSAGPVLARLANPPHDVSAMDGYALRGAEATIGATFRLVGEAAAGHPWAGSIGSGEALRVFTGSVLPDGADTVLVQEDAAADGQRIDVLQAASPGRHIRRTGQDFAQDAVLIEPGRRLGARDVGLAAAGNHPWVWVRRRPRVGILATGDEVALPGEPIPPGGIVSSNGFALVGLVRAAGGEALMLPVVADDREALAAALALAATMDLLLTIGGASVGDHDLVRAALQEQGMALDFWKIAMRPGKPLMHGRLGATPVIGLPGNPVSALVTALLFVRPAVEVLGGLPAAEPPLRTAVLEQDIAQNDVRADYVRATVSALPDGTLRAKPLKGQDSAMLRALADADALIVRAPHAPAASAGSTVNIMPLNDIGF